MIHHYQTVISDTNSAQTMGGRVIPTRDTPFTHIPPSAAYQPGRVHEKSTWQGYDDSILPAPGYQLPAGAGVGTFVNESTQAQRPRNLITVLLRCLRLFLGRTEKRLDTRTPTRYASYSTAFNSVDSPRNQ